MDDMKLILLLLLPAYYYWYADKLKSWPKLYASSTVWLAYMHNMMTLAFRRTSACRNRLKSLLEEYEDSCVPGEEGCIDCCCGTARGTLLLYHTPGLGVLKHILANLNVLIIIIIPSLYIQLACSSMNVKGLLWPSGLTKYWLSSSLSQNSSARLYTMARDMQELCAVHTQGEWVHNNESLNSFY